MRQRKKTNKLSLSAKVLSLLACLAIMSVGFASWLIINVPDPVETTGSFEVYEVQDRSVEFANESFTNEGKITFGKPMDYTADEDDWLVPSSDVEDVSLSTSYSFTVKTKDENVNINDTLASITFAFDKNAVLDGVSPEYIAAPLFTVTVDGTEVVTKAAYAEGTGYTYSIDMSAIEATSAVIKIDIEFGWGTAFDSINPYTHFNGLGATEDNIAAAKTAIQSLFDSGINSAKYKFTITPVKAAQ